jgi:hypothetical protein
VEVADASSEQPQWSLGKLSPNSSSKTLKIAISALNITDCRRFFEQTKVRPDLAGIYFAAMIIYCFEKTLKPA